MQPNSADLEYARILLKAQQLNHELKPAELIIVLCSYDIRVAEYAAELYVRSYAPLVVFSGDEGAATRGRFPASEAETFARAAIAKGVPGESIILETRAKNTGENVRFSRKLLATKGILPRRVIAVQKPHMELRTLATFEKLWPDLELIVTSPRLTLEELPVPWLDLRAVIEIITGDFQRVLEYPKLGYQTEQRVSPEAVGAFEALVQRGYTGRLIARPNPDVE